MIGNDLICWEKVPCHTPARWSRYAQKILLETEQNDWLHAALPGPMLMLWWAAKESAYKCWRRAGGTRSWNPKSFAVEIHDWSPNQAGFSVHSSTSTYEGKAAWNEYYLTATVQQKSPANVFSRVGLWQKEIMSTASMQMQQVLLQELSSRFGLDPCTLSVRKNTLGVPELWNANQPMEMALSMSHHGNYWAYSYVSTPGSKKK